VRFTVEANGTVSKAEALAEAPRRFARPATDAVLQWQFAPLPQARTVDVEIAFRRG
jgi:Gram-negative bacterial TonB protein C-terminal